ncbi:MAG: hypothetical protein AAF726_15865 [Planctomycetota bacterium]
MNRTAPALAASLALPLLVAFSVNGADKIAFAPSEGTVVIKKFVATTVMEMDDMSMTMNGESNPAMPEIEMAMEMVNNITVTDEYGPITDGQPAKLTRTYDAIDAELEMDVTMNMMGNEDTQSPSGAGSSELEGSTVTFTWDGDAGEYEVAYAEGEEGDSDLLDGLVEDMDLRSLLPEDELSEGESYDIELAKLVDVLAPGGDLKLDMEVDGESAAMGPDAQMMQDYRRFFEDLLEGEATGTYTGTRDVGGAKVAVIELDIDIDASADMSDMAAEMMGGQDIPAEMSIDRMDVNMTYAGKGEMLWNLSAGHVHSLDMKADITIGMDMAMGMDMGGQTMDIGMEMAMSGTVNSQVTTE